ncbi:MAG TPA: transglutaminase family protein [Candidatus Acidoferrum sp.]|nr:transglutaminase family protein [Candidatus Acidoferrum sp.]
MQAFLASSPHIDWEHPAVLAKARELATGVDDIHALIERCFVFVRDQIKHSWDYKLNPVTCKASDVLAHGTGYCYAKSHLLAALLRANGIPTGLCYQRLTFTDDQPPYTLHGLNAVQLDGIGWYRLDARGNKEGVDAQFTPPVERLAFAIKFAGEMDLPEVWPEPLPVVVEALTRYTTVQQVAANLPDVELINR